jgi:hypothetical protein
MRNNFSKKLGLSIATFGMVAASMLTGQDAEAMPGFARQTGMPCNACHFQNFPALGSMGRGFKQGGYTMEGSQASIEGENQLKLPIDLNMGGVIKLRHTKDSDAKIGSLDFPDEAAILVGGRLSANAGMLWEFATKGGELLGIKYVFNAYDNDGINFQVIPYSTDGQGATYGAELMNTAALGLQRFAEDKSGSAPVQLGFVSPAVGLDFVANGSNWMASYNLFAPEWGEHAPYGDVTGMANMIRVNYFMDLAGFDTGIGYGMFGGKYVSPGTDAAGEVDVTAATSSHTVGGSWLDVQLQGQLAGMDTGIYISSGTNPVDQHYSTGTEAGSWTGLGAKMSVTPELSVMLQQGSGKNTAEGNKSSSSLGLQYMIAQNIKFEFYQYSHTADSDGASAVSGQRMMVFLGM